MTGSWPTICGRELLGQLPPEQMAFLTRTAVLEHMSGPLCDAVLETTGSSEVLGWAGRSPTCWWSRWIATAGGSGDSRSVIWLEHYPPVAVLGALVQALVGLPVRAERWADAVEHRVATADPASVARRRQTAARWKATWVAPWAVVP